MSAVPTPPRSRSHRPALATGRRLALVGALTVSVLVAACGIQGRALPTINAASSGTRTQIFDKDGNLITEIAGDERRQSVPLDQIPRVVQNAVVSIEDERFWEHSGVDPKGILRAARKTSEAGAVAQGGSTITQQYVKNVLLSSEQNIQRKIQEASLAYQLEKTHTKEFILEQYLNTIWFGNRSYGVQEASLGYFGHPVQDVTIPEAAMLAGVIQSPTRTNPYKDPVAAKKRRDVVLGKMLSLGYITQEEHDAAVATPITLSDASSTEAQQRYDAPHFVEEVKNFIRTDKRFGDTEDERNNLLVNGGLRIYTTVDVAMQRKAEADIKKIYPDQDRPLKDGRKDPDIGLVAIEARTGYVRAMVGGYDYFDTNTAVHPYAQYNLAVGKGRQAGSTFKPIVLAAALANGVKPTATFPSPGRTVIRVAGQAPWSVKGDALGAKASLTQCVIHSANTCFANLIADKRVGVDRATEFAGKMGIDITPWDPATKTGFKRVLSLVLGTNDSTVLDMTEAYTTFANRGLHVPATMVTKVVDANGTVLYQHQHTQTKVLEPEAADAITKMLEGVLVSGTAAGKGIGRPAAGKTGTTQNATDAWFIGYTPDLVTGVWAGYSETSKKKVGQAGATAAAPVWQRFMIDALKDVPPSNFDESSNPVVTTTTVPPSNTAIFQPLAATTMVTMPSAGSGNVNDAVARLKRAGLVVQRIDVPNPPGVVNGQVLGQAPAAGSSVPKGATVTIEATPGNPPPAGPVPDIVGQLATDAVPGLQKLGYTVTANVVDAPAGFLLPSGLPPGPGVVWSISPAIGTISPDGKLTLGVQSIPTPPPVPPTGP
ncbi:MAG: PBP1A family penicillin-binding protein [Acidimicrobiales bacterium]